jgi:hypothetical protein
VGGGLDLLGPPARLERDLSKYASPNATARPRPSSPRSSGGQANRRSSAGGTPSSDRSFGSSDRSGPGAMHLAGSPRAGIAGGSDGRVNSGRVLSGSNSLGDAGAEIVGIQDTLEAQALFLAALVREQQSIREAQEAMAQNMLFLNKNMVFMNGNISLLRERLEDLMEHHGVAKNCRVAQTE